MTVNAKPLWIFTNLRDCLKTWIELLSQNLFSSFGDKFVDTRYYTLIKGCFMFSDFISSEDICFDYVTYFISFVYSA